MRAKIRWIEETTKAQGFLKKPEHACKTWFRKNIQAIQSTPRPSSFPNKAHPSSPQDMVTLFQILHKASCKVPTLWAMLNLGNKIV